MLRTIKYSTRRSSSHASNHVARLVRLGLLLLTFSLLVSSSGFAPLAKAQGEQPLADTPPYGGIDLVFLVDQSGSMRDNDPFSQRANAIKWVLQYLGIDNLFARREATHRVGVVSFGSGATIDLDLTGLRFQDEKAWNAQYKDLEKQVVAKNMVNTDVLEGLKLVKEVFEKTGSSNTDRSATRTRGIIILTDGAPYREGWQTDPRYAGTDFYTPYFKEVGEFIRENFPIAQSPRSTEGYHIWVLGLNAKEDTGQQSAPGTSWVEQENRWERILNPSVEMDRVKRIASDRNAKIPDDIVRVLDTMMVGGVCNDEAAPTEKPSCIVEERFVVPPYVARANFSVFKPVPTSQVAFFTPDNQVLDRNNASVEVLQTGEVIETVSVENPLPGRWRWQKIDSSAGRATVVFQSLFGQARLIEPKSSQDLFDTVTLQIALEDLNGQRMTEWPEYPITVEATVVVPDGMRFLYQLDAQGDGTWRAKQGILLDQPGAYRVLLNGLSKDIDGKPVKLFGNWTAEFTAGSLVPNLVQPPGDVLLFHQTPIEIRLLKPDGSEPGFSTQYTVKLEAEFETPDGKRIPLNLRQQPAANTYYADPIIGQLPGRHSVITKGFMDVGGKTTTLFEKSLSFNVDCVRVDMPAPSGDQPQNGLTDIQVSVNNCSGTPYQEDPSLPWEVVAQIEGPGAQKQVTLTRAADGVYKGQFSPDVPGSWQVVAYAHAIAPTGDKLLAFDGVSRQIEVYPTTLIRLHVLTPKTGERQKIRSVPRIPPIPESTLGRPRALQIRTEILDLSDRPLPINALGQTPEEIVLATLFGPRDLAAGRPVTLTIDSDNPTQLIANIPDLRYTGAYTLSLALDSLRREYLPETQQAMKVTFQRNDPFRFVTYGVLAAEIILLLLLVFALVRAIVVRINPVKGTLEFEAIGVGNKQSLGTLVLGSYGKNSFVIDESTLRTQLDPRVSDVISKLKIKNASTRRTGRSSTIDPESASSAAIKIWGWGPDKEQFLDGQEFSDNNLSELLVGDVYVRYRLE